MESARNPARSSPARGFRLAQRDAANEWWVHPSGNEVTRNYSSGDAPSQTVAEEAPPGPEGAEDWPAQLDAHADREDLFGSIVASRDNADVAFGTGELVRYADGTVELFQEGTTDSYVFRPRPGGGYVVYGPDGRRLQGIWRIPQEDIPDPDTEADE